MGRFKIGDKIRNLDGITTTIIRESDGFYIVSEGYTKKVFGKKMFIKHPMGIPIDDDRWELVKDVMA